MTDGTPAQAAKTDTQAVDGQQVEQEQLNTGHEWTLDTAMAEIKALRAEAGKYRTAARAADKARSDAETAALAEQGRYKELYDATAQRLAEYEPAKARLDEVLAMVQATNAKRREAIPESMRSLVPDYDDPLKLAAWLDANSAVFQKPPAPSLDGRAGGGSVGVTVTDEEVVEFAVRMGVNPNYVDRAALAKMKR